MNIAILGAGAVGSYLGGMLATGSTQVTLITTNVAHCDAIKRQGLAIHSANKVVQVELDCCHPENYTGSPDIIIVLCKAHQTQAALNGIAESISEHTLLLSLQNGLGYEQVFSQFVDKSQIMLGNTMAPVERVSPGVVELRGRGQTAFNLLNPETSNASSLKRRDALCERLIASGVDSEVDDAIFTRLWHKASFNAGMNAVGAIARCTNGNLASSDAINAMVVSAAMEGLEVAQAQRIAVDSERVKEMISFACANHAEHRASMVQDVLLEKPTEVDAINGEIVRQGAALGVATPTNDLLYAMVKLIEQSYANKL